MEYHSPSFRWVIPGLLARSGRPGFPDIEVDAAAVEIWLGRAVDEGIQSIICLLHDDQVGWWYRNLDGGLLARYRQAGFHVVHFNAQDSRTPPFYEHQLPPIMEAFRALPKPVLVHCSLGRDRTGQAIDFILGELAASGIDSPGTVAPDPEPGTVFLRFEV